MPSEPIQFFNRYSQKLEAEEVYGAGFLQWIYGNPLGKLALHALVKRSIFSHWYGWRMDRPASRKKIQPFIKQFHVDTAEFADPPSSFRTFNEFFHRRLKASARPVNAREDVAVFPADGRHLGFSDISKAGGIFVKGEVFGLGELLGDRTLAKRFQDGSLVLSRLCPVDYHRFHFPVAGTPDTPRLINGPLFSVNPIALRQNIHIFSQNKRAICRIQSTAFGEVLMLEIGATCVGSFNYTFHPGTHAAKGAERGFFKFGGSSVITIFEPGRVLLNDDLLDGGRDRCELYAQVGDQMGTLKH
ncbi:MAG: phosphatidylserine decarboxylase [Pedosphaera sp.]|nr:phosphatidylserine decarboxylase [Pedosphaera sp.]